MASFSSKMEIPEYLQEFINDELKDSFYYVLINSSMDKTIDEDKYVVLKMLYLMKNKKMYNILDECLIKDYSEELFHENSLKYNTINKDNYIDYFNYNSIDKDGNTAFIFLIKNNQEDLALELLESNPLLCKLDYTIKSELDSDDIGTNAFFEACIHKMSKLILKMLDTYPEYYNFDLIQPMSNDTVLMIVCRNKMTEVALRMLEIEPMSCNLIHTNNNIQTVLLVACAYNLPQVALKLLEYKELTFNVDSNDSYTIYTCIHFAISDSSLMEVVLLMLNIIEQSNIENYRKVSIYRQILSTNYYSLRHNKIHIKQKIDSIIESLTT